MGLDAREGKRELIFLVVAAECGIRQKLRSRALPSAPDFRSGEPDGGVVAGESAMIGGKQIAAFVLGDVGEVRLPCIRIEDRSAPLVKPIDLLFAQQEDPAHNKFRRSLRV